MDFKLKHLFLMGVALSVFALTGCSQLDEIKTQTEQSSFVQSSSTSKTPVSTDIEQKLLQYTEAQSSGDNQNYYWGNGPAQLSNFGTLKAGDNTFISDSQGRSSIAKAVLTYDEYQSSKGKRQGSPLDPPAWPQNEKVAIAFSLTGRTYHGYMYNRSHSIADSLLGKVSYSSPYNFTTGTRSQNVGANQKGGMRAAEEYTENYWKEHPGTQTTIQYQTTPVYHDNETIPRGSIVDIKSSDGALNREFVIINSAEGYQIDYKTGNFS